jgi:hypothetical protein
VKKLLFRRVAPSARLNRWGLQAYRIAVKTRRELNGPYCPKP